MADFTDVATGRKNDREEYMRMLERVAQGGISNIVVLFLDRFGRNPREILRRHCFGGGEPVLGIFGHCPS